MITRSGDPHRQPRRILGVALLLSLLLHQFLFLGLHFDRVQPRDSTKRKREPTETITISTAARRAPQAVARAQPRSARRASPPRPKRPVVARPRRVAYAAVPRPVIKPIVVPPYRPPVTPVRQATAAPKTVALATAIATAQSRQPANARYSTSQIAQIEGDLAKSIRASRGSENPLSNVPREAPAVAPKHYSLDYQAVDGNLRSAQGICDPIKDWQADGWDYYYAACNVEEPDGSMQRKAMPWPVRWRPRDDPWSGMNGRPTGPMPLPPPGWRPDPEHPVDPDYLAYLRHNGYPI